MPLTNQGPECVFKSTQPHNKQWPTVSVVLLQAIMEAAQLKVDGKAQRVIVTGCLAQRYSQDLSGKCSMISRT